MPRPARLAVVVWLVAVLLAPAPAGAGPIADRAGACVGSDGVTVVVDFGSLGGGTVVRCAPGRPSSGLDALSKAGFGYGFRPGFAGMVCTIASQPNPCNGAPLDAYWAYWHAPAGGSWTYSTQGAGSRTPPPGSVEGWAFGAERRPSVAPPTPTPTPTTAPAPPPTTAAPPTTTRPPAPTTASPATPGAPTVTTGTTGTSRPVPGTATSPPLTPETAPNQTDDTVETDASDETAFVTVPTDGAADDSVAELALAPTSSNGGGAAAGLVGAALVAAVVAATGWEFRRRRLPDR